MPELVANHVMTAPSDSLQPTHYCTLLIYCMARFLMYRQ